MVEFKFKLWLVLLMNMFAPMLCMSQLSAANPHARYTQIRTQISSEEYAQLTRTATALVNQADDAIQALPDTHKVSFGYQNLFNILQQLADIESVALVDQTINQHNLRREPLQKLHVLIGSWKSNQEDLVFRSTLSSELFDKYKKFICTQFNLLDFCGHIEAARKAAAEHNQSTLQLETETLQDQKK